MSYEFAQGDTFSVSGPVSVKNAEGEPLDLSTWRVSGRVRFVDEGDDVSVPATWIEAGVTVRLSTNNTNRWPFGQAELTLKFTSPSGESVSTKAAHFEVVE